MGWARDLMSKTPHGDLQDSSSYEILTVESGLRFYFLTVIK